MSTLVPTGFEDLISRENEILLAEGHKSTGSVGPGPPPSSLPPKQTCSQPVGRASEKRNPPLQTRLDDGDAVDYAVD
jgi:hypothetical protein